MRHQPCETETERMPREDRDVYYGIVRGAGGYTGIQTEWWGGAEPLIRNQRYAKYKRFRTYTEAQSFVRFHSQRRAILDREWKQKNQEAGQKRPAEPTLRPLLAAEPQRDQVEQGEEEPHPEEGWAHWFVRQSIRFTDLCHSGIRRVLDQAERATRQ